MAMVIDIVAHKKTPPDGCGAAFCGCKYWTELDIKQKVQYVTVFYYVFLAFFA